MADIGCLDVSNTSTSLYYDHMMALRRVDVELDAYRQTQVHDDPVHQEYVVRVGNKNVRIPYYVAQEHGDITVHQACTPDVVCKELSSNAPIDCSNPYESVVKNTKTEKEKTRRTLCSDHLFVKKR
jgi:hypothetical protein